VLQFLRYAALAAAEGAQVVAEVQPPLVRLAATCPGVAELAVRGEALPEVDLQVPLLSLPRLFGTELASIPAEIPYFRPPAGEEVGEDVDRLLGPPHRGLRVGVVWAGNPDFPGDAERSCPPRQLEPLTRVAGVRLASLQFGDRAKELSELPAGSLVDLRPVLGDFARTAALLTHLDLVLTIDTSMAHLAGALGRPVWNLLSHRPDWRWLKEGEATPWYPTMRLVRQRRPGDWAELVERVAAELAELAARHR
jgi:hypothetical protein